MRHKGCAAFDIQEGKWQFFFYLQFSVDARPDKIPSPLLIFKNNSFDIHKYEMEDDTLELPRIRIFSEKSGSERIRLHNFQKLPFRSG